MQSVRDESTPFLLKEEDAPELAALESACFALPWSEEQYRKVLGRAAPAPEEDGPRPAGPHPACQLDEPLAVLPATPVFGLRAANGELAAYVCLGVYQAIREMEIYNIAVRDSFRRKGLGKRLLFYALDAARRAGIARALLEVRPSNAAALALYASAGFAVCGCRRKYYKDSGEDALILARDLASGVL